MTAPDRDAGIAVLVDGFFDNPVLAWIFEDESTRAEAIDAWFRFWLDHYGEHAVLVVEADDGAALWASPEAPGVDGESAAPLLALVQKYNGDRTGLVLGGIAAVPAPPGEHYYLNAIAARRGNRARGIGARLLEPFLARADQEEVPIYLESSNPRNLSFYRRYGFVDLGPRIDLPGDGPPLQPMGRLVSGRS